MREALGNDGVTQIALASLAGAASSSCSYASAAISRILFKKGAALIPSLAFLFASTNLVIELGIILYLLLGWQFMAGEWVGGVVLIAIMAVLVRITYPNRLVEQARQHPEHAATHQHSEMTAPGETLLKKLRDPRTRILIAQISSWTGRCCGRICCSASSLPGHCQRSSRTAFGRRSSYATQQKD
jgi:hypothetical protein